MNELITYSEMKDLKRRVNLLCENDGIENQIIHLQQPDDNECFDSVFFYLETEISKVIQGWLSIVERLSEFKEERL